MPQDTPQPSKAFLGLPAPVFIPAVSSVAKSSLAWSAHIRALVDWEVPSFLISAYDLARCAASDRSKLLSLLGTAIARGAVVLLDSGGYEARWLRDRSWSFAEYCDALSYMPHTAAFTYDLDGVEPIAAFEEAAAVTDSRRLIPILHGSTESILPSIDEMAAAGPAAIATTERESGDGIAEVALNLRRVAASIGGRVPLHLLGAGNPKSILMYAACGVSSFDGLDWCQAVADPDTVTMHHYNHLGFYEDGVGANRSISNYPLRLLAHNLFFFSEWLETIRRASADDRLNVLVDAILTKSAEETA